MPQLPRHDIWVNFQGISHKALPDITENSFNLVLHLANFAQIFLGAANFLLSSQI